MSRHPWGTDEEAKSPRSSVTCLSLGVFFPNRVRIQIRVCGSVLKLFTLIYTNYTGKPPPPENSLSPEFSKRNLAEQGNGRHRGRKPSFVSTNCQPSTLLGLLHVPHPQNRGPAREMLLCPEMVPFYRWGHWVTAKQNDWNGLQFPHLRNCRIELDSLWGLFYF